MIDIDEPVRSDISVHDSIYKRFEIEFRALLTEGTPEVKLTLA